MGDTATERNQERERERGDKKTLAEAFLEAARKGLPTRYDPDDKAKGAARFGFRFRRRSG